MRSAPLAAFRRARGEPPAGHRVGPQALDGWSGRKQEAALADDQVVGMQGVRPWPRSMSALGRGPGGASDADGIVVPFDQDADHQQQADQAVGHGRHGAFVFLGLPGGRGHRRGDLGQMDARMFEGRPGGSLLLNGSGLGGSDGFGRGSIVRLDGLTEGQQTEDGSDKQCVFHDSPQVDVFIVCPLAGKGYE